MTTLQRRSAIVTGGGSGVGRATVLALASQGTRVFAVGRDGARLERVRTEATGPGEVTARALDVTDGPAVEQLFADADRISSSLRPASAPDGADARIDLGGLLDGVEPRRKERVQRRTSRDPAAARAGQPIVISCRAERAGGSPLSGGYAGAKRTQMFLAGYLQRSAEGASRACGSWRWSRSS